MVNEDFVPMIKRMPGFLSYYCIAAGKGTWATVSIFDTDPHTEESPAAALLVGYRSIQICALLTPVRLGPPCRRPILNATTSPLYVRRYTSYGFRSRPTW